MNKVFIGPFTYEVRLVDNLRGSRGEWLWGYINHSTHTISIEKTAPKERQVAALLHEMVHGCLDNTGRTADVKEEVIEGLGVTLYEAMLRSGMLSEFNVGEEYWCQRSLSAMQRNPGPRRTTMWTCP